MFAFCSLTPLVQCITQRLEKLKNNNAKCLEKLVVLQRKAALMMTQISANNREILSISMRPELSSDISSEFGLDPLEEERTDGSAGK